MFSWIPTLSNFDSELPNLKNGYQMFIEAAKITEFVHELPNLTNGCQMFDKCYKLTTFTSSLPNLTNGYQMFSGCNLNSESVQNIADTIKDVNGLENSDDTNGDIYRTIHMKISNKTPNDQETTAFNKIASKGWTVYVNGSETPWEYSDGTSLAPLDGEQTYIPTPFWAKPVEATEKTAKYVDDNGNFFNILGGQFIYGDDISTYGMFTCEEDAAANMRLTPYIKPQTEIENQ
jgi:hypothetical protein